MQQYVAMVASDHSHVLGECPQWDDRSNEVRWVDAARGHVLRGRLREKVELVDRLVVGDVVGSVRMGPKGLVVAGRRCVTLLDPWGGRAPIATLVPPNVDSRLNDGACDPLGRFLVGSMSLDGRHGQERLFSIDLDNSVRVLDGDLTLSNGICWSPDGRIMYSVDSTPRRVWQRSYDPDSGRVGQREVFVDVDDGLPDGLCVDIRGRLWVAVWGTGQVRCFNPDGELSAIVVVDASQVTSCAFVGPDLQTLLITSATEGMDRSQQARYLNAGRLFVADVGVSGARTHDSGLRVAHGCADEPAG